MEMLRKKIKGLRRRFPNLYSVVMGASFILFVRGIIGFADIFLFPNMLPLSYGISIALGLFILYLNDFKLKELE